MRPSCLLAAFALLACLSVAQCRKLRQVASVTDYTNSNNTFLASSVVVSAGTTAESATDCITLCANDAYCTFWSWCPADQTAGCSVAGVAGGAATTVAAKGCLLTYDDTQGRNSVFAMSGSAVTFAGGKYYPSNILLAPPGASPTPSPPALDPTNPASWIDPSGTPAECNGWFSGDQWSGDEIECHVCDGDYQLKCDLDTDLIGDDSIKCEFDSAGLGSLVNNAVEFDCVVDWSKVPQNQCNWDDVVSKLPACASEPVRRILATWKPDE